MGSSHDIILQGNRCCNIKYLAWIKASMPLTRKQDNLSKLRSLSAHPNMRSGRRPRDTKIAYHAPFISATEYPRELARPREGRPELYELTHRLVKYRSQFYRPPAPRFCSQPDLNFLPQHLTVFSLPRAPTNPLVPSRGGF